MPSRPEPRHGEVWNVLLDPVQGDEQGGVRPALVISNDRFKRAFEILFVIVPFTRTDRVIPSQVRVFPPDGGSSAPSLIMREQIRVVSIARFRTRRGDVSGETLQKVEPIILRLISRQPSTG